MIIFFNGLVAKLTGLHLFLNLIKTDSLKLGVILVRTESRPGSETRVSVCLFTFSGVPTYCGVLLVKTHKHANFPLNKDSDKKRKPENVTHQYVNRLILGSRLILYISFEIFLNGHFKEQEQNKKTRFIISVRAGKYDDSSAISSVSVFVRRRY